MNKPCVNETRQLSLYMHKPKPQSSRIQYCLKQKIAQAQIVLLHTDIDTILANVLKFLSYTDFI